MVKLQFTQTFLPLPKKWVLILIASRCASYSSLLCNRTTRNNPKRVIMIPKKMVMTKSKWISKLRYRVKMLNQRIKMTVNIKWKIANKI